MRARHHFVNHFGVVRRNEKSLVGIRTGRITALASRNTFPI